MMEYGTITDRNRRNMMEAQQTAFERPCLEYTNQAMESLMLPQTIFINVLLSSLKLTTKERESREAEDPCYERYVMLSLLLPTLLILIVLYLPVSSIAFAIWTSLQSHRRCYRLRVSNIAVEARPRALIGGKSLSIVSIDTSLLTEYRARWDENLGETQKRAVKIAEGIISEMVRVVVSDNSSREQNKFHTNDEDNDITERSDTPTNTETKRGGTSKTTTYFDVVKDFPFITDLVCFQGVFDHRAEKKLVKHLSKYFPYIVYEVTENSWRTNRFRYGSGLVLASQLPVSQIDFLCFQESVGDDRIKAKGILMATLGLGTGSDGKERQMRIFNMELQEGHEPEAVTARMSQLSQLDTHRAGSDVIPELYCGNLHFDNVSLDEKENWSHPFFDVVTDPCTLRPGDDMPGAIGTELKVKRIHDKEISSPASMKKMLETSEVQTEFLEEIQRTSEVQRTSAGGPTDVMSGRRTNRILYKHSTDVKLEITRHRAVTKLTGLTTYLPLTADLLFTEEQ